MDPILQRLSTLTDAELRMELKAAGQPCGGIAKTTRKFFEKRLAKHLLVITATLSSGLDITDDASMTAQMTSSSELDTPDGAQKSLVKSDTSVEKTDGVSILIEKSDKADTTDGTALPHEGGSVTTTLFSRRNHHDTSTRGRDSMKHCGKVVLENRLNGNVSSDGLFYVVQIPPALETMETDVPDAPTFKAPLCNGRVYQNRKEAFDLMKKNKTARFKVFKSFEEAEEFVTSNEDLSTPKRTEPTQMTPTSNKSISESANSFYSPKNQQLVRLRKAIEANDIGTFKDIVWNNPRYLISSGDTPTIMKEGPRYNALHVTALANLAPMCRLILDTLEDTKFFALMYPEDSPETRQKRQEVLVDLYLNTPDKGNGETPLHFASKFGNPDVLSILVDHVMCDKTAKNKYGQTAKEIVCSRSSGNEIVQRRIIHLLEDNYYVPVLRSEDNSTQPLIGEPWSPDQSPLHQIHAEIHRRKGSPVDISICTKAYAGPMSPSKAETFHKHLRTPPSAESKRAAAIRRADGDKGLERVARELARSMHVPWSEYWDFLDAYADLASKKGLEKLENYLKERQPAQKTDFRAGGDKINATKQRVDISEDIVSNLLADFENLSVKTDNESQSQDIPNRTSNTGAMEGTKAENTSSNTGAITTDIEMSDRTKTSSEHADGVQISGEEKTQQTVTGKQDNMDAKMDIQTSAIDTSIGTQECSEKDKETEVRMEVATSHQRKESGNGDNFGSLMVTPKSKCGHSMFTGASRGVQQVFLIGNEPTKLDLDVLRAISHIDSLNKFPHVQQWSRWVQAVPEDESKRWPTPSRYRSRSNLASRTPTPSPQNISTTQRLLRYGSPIHAGSPSRILIGSPYLRSRHMSDPGGGRQQRRVVPGASPGAGAQDRDPRQKLFP